MSGRAVEGPPGSRWLALALLGLPGGALAAYLTYARWADRPAVCGGIGECELVQTSEYSDAAGVPVALLGLAYFLVMSLLAVARISRVLGAPAWAQPVAFSLALAGTAFVAYLTYVELFVLNAVCAPCVGLAALTAAGLGLTAWGLFSDG